MTVDGSAETPNIAALPAIVRLGACELARRPDADRHVKLLIEFAGEGSRSSAYSQSSLNWYGTAECQRSPYYFCHVALAAWSAEA
jgi:hypothetical protein